MIPFSSDADDFPGNVSMGSSRSYPPAAMNRSAEKASMHWLILSATAISLAMLGQEVAADTFTFRAPFSSRQCQAGLVLAGIRHDHGYITCRRIDSNLYETRPATVSRGAAGQLPASQWPSTAPASLKLPYNGPSIHWCGPGKALVGYTVDNQFTCQEIRRKPSNTGPMPLTQLKLDGPPPHISGSFTQLQYQNAVLGRSDSMHACPNGYVLMGMHLDANIFLCGRLP